MCSGHTRLALPRVRIAIVALGNIANHQINALKALSKEFELVAGCDTKSELAFKIEAEGGRYFPTLSDLLKFPTIDAVIVSVPNKNHYEVARNVLIAGKHVLVEKPATDTIAQFQELSYIARDNNRRLYTNFHAAFAPELNAFVERREQLYKQYGCPSLIFC